MENNPDIEVVGMLDIDSHDHSKRVHSTEGISPTVTAVSGGTHHIKIFDTSKLRVRKLTPTEYGRLQAFPVDDGWEQVVSDSQAYKQFGNAVTVNVVAGIAGAIKNLLDSAMGLEMAENTSRNAQEVIEEKITSTTEKLSEHDGKPEIGLLAMFSNEELLAELQRRMTVNV